MQSLFVSSTDASRVRDNLATATQPILDFLNQYMQPNPDGSLTIRGAVAMGAATIASATINGAVQVLGQLTANALSVLGDVSIVNGNLTVRTRTGNGVVIVPAGGSPALYVTNPAGTQALYLVYADGSVVCQSISSVLGFKTSVPCGEYWNTAPGANSFFPFGRVVQNVQNLSVGFTPFYYKWTHSGSVVGMSLNEAGPNVAEKRVYVYRNGTLVFTWVAGSGGNNATFWQAFTKGNILFTQGDTMQLNGQVGSTANTQLYLHLTLEMSA